MARRSRMTNPARWARDDMLDPFLPSRVIDTLHGDLKRVAPIGSRPLKFLVLVGGALIGHPDPPYLHAVYQPGWVMRARVCSVEVAISVGALVPARASDHVGAVLT